jgi:ferric-dicitrate binding protein FerR (iron transport regulator)
VAKSDSMVKIEPLVKTILYTSWKDEKWIIEGQTLGYLAKEFERRYNLQISFDNEAIKNYKFNGILTDETFEQVLKVIKLSAPIDFTVTNNQVLLKENTNAKNHYDKYLKR